MTPDPIFFRDLAYVFLAAVVGGGLAWMARQPLILGYVIGGILISPFTPGFSVSDVHTSELFAEIGVVLLMFSIGIEFSFQDLMRVKWVALAGGPLGILLSIGLAMGVGALLGWTSLQGVVIGAVISVASTMVLARLLLDRGELHSRHGRVMIGITLVEDLAVVALTVLLPSLGAFEPGRLFLIGLALAKAGLILIPFSYLTAKVFPPIMTRVARTQNQELFLLVALAIGFGTAAFSQMVGLSLALGAFLAGLIISGSDYAHETLARLLSLRDVFVAFFFVTIGVLIDPAIVFANLPLLGVMIALIMVGKLLIWTLVVRVFGYAISTAFLVGVGLTQIGEFSFVLVQVARTAGHVGDEVYNATLAASLLTILMNAPLVRYVPTWMGMARLSRERRSSSAKELDPEVLRDHVVICGFGRVGSSVGAALETFGIPYMVIELDPDIISGLRARSIPCLFGDASHRQLLMAAGADRTMLVVVTLPEIERAKMTVRRLRTINSTVLILARAHGRMEAESLRVIGATEVIQPELEASATLIRYALDHLALPKERTAEYLDRYRDAILTAREQTAGTPQVLAEVREVKLTEGGTIDQSLREAQIRERFGVTVVGIIRSDGTIVQTPSADTILRPGDRLRIFGLPSQIDTFVSAAETPKWVM
ncbi:MAG: cation:proton antiporter [Nitrospiraceae bacterium]